MDINAGPEQAEVLNTSFDERLPASRDVAPSPGHEQWEAVKDFQIITANGGNTLYGNGRQQVKVRVLIRVTNALNMPVDIDEQSLASLTLVDTHTHKPLEWGVVQSRDDEVWAFVYDHDPRFTPFPYHGPIKGGLEGGKFSVREFYVSTNASFSISLSASITRHDGKVFYSGLKTEFGTLTLNAVLPAVYQAHHVNIKHVAQRPYRSANIAKVDVYALRMVVDNQRIGIARIYEVYPSTFLKLSEHPDYLGYYATAYLNASPGYYGRYQNFEMPHAVAKYYDVPGELTLLVSYAKKGGRSQVREEHDHWRLDLIDIYGNLHTVRIVSSDESPPRLIVQA
ncbi:hypothetical protein [Pseudomonas weihenstephanensis]|uniref:hypothetical protein n=1 Tax=Pseudomonas weihenstephanensis TaxID=1608994 RepID=UPI000654A735|nr:hypothetical protein [Pseudomonas weihenstephanensis]KMN20550.1 hypothetical protein TU87_03005 [Pseudomonas weihenstephanensis]